MTRTAFGIFVLGENMEVEIASPLRGDRLLENQLQEIKKRNPKKIIVEEPGLMSQLKEVGLSATLEQPSRGGKWARAHLRELSTAIDVQNPEKLIRSMAIEASTRSVTKASSSLEQELISAVSAYDTLTKSINELGEKLLELNDLYFPELRRSVRSVEKAAQILREYPSRELLSSGTAGSKVPKELIQAAEKSPYALPPPQTANVMSQFASSTIQLVSMRETLNRRITEIMESEAPNLTVVAGPLLGSKLIAKAGGMMNLVKLPASSIQVMGAEKALFRSMKEGTRPPKHGLIFQHPSIHGAPKRLRGKAARIVASKISIAIKLDVFSGIERGEELNESIKKRLETLSRRQK